MSTTQSPISYTGVRGLGLPTPISTGSAVGTAATAASSFATLGISAGVALTAQGIQMWIQSARLRGQQKIGATNIANQVEGKLKELKKAYDASAKTKEDWLQAKQSQDALYDYLAGPQGCGSAELGSAGQRCIAERLCDSGCVYPWKTWYDLGEMPAASAKTSSGNLSTVDVALSQSVQVGNSSVSVGVLFAVGLGLVALMMIGGD